jgi:ornithine cyclodeaminase/alanine dehydrogenase-like protein (mu-crystallin family)
LIVGTGRIARELARCHMAMHPQLREISIWGRSTQNATLAAQELAAVGIAATVVTDLNRAAARADLISVATLAHTPLVLGTHVRQGTHVDLVGAFTPQMREADDELIAKAHVFVDTTTALAEAGDLLEPLQRGVLDAAAVVDLAALCRGSRPGRQSTGDITLFKSVGSALEDLAAAIAVYEAS